MPVDCFRDARGGVSSWQLAQPKQRAVVSKDVRRLSDICEMRINIITQVRIVFNMTSGTMRMADAPRPRVFSRGDLSEGVKRPAEGGALWGGD
jgi:hypothetical protein